MRVETYVSLGWYLKPIINFLYQNSLVQDKEMLLKTKYFTKGERILGRLLQENHISFKTKVDIGGREIDFIIGNLLIEVDGHPQKEEKNNLLVNKGYKIIHFTNKEIYENRGKVGNIIKNIIK